MYSQRLEPGERGQRLARSAAEAVPVQKELLQSPQRPQTLLRDLTQTVIAEVPEGWRR